MFVKRLFKDINLAAFVFFFFIGGQELLANNSEFNPSFFSNNSSYVPSKNISRTSSAEWIHYSGEFALKTSYNYKKPKGNNGKTDFRGSSQLKPYVYIESSGKISDEVSFFASSHAFYDFIYNIKNNDFSRSLISSYESEIELDQAYILLNNDNFFLKFGRQIYSWEYSDYLINIDRLNPLDTRYPGMEDFTKLKLPVTSLLVENQIHNWYFSAVAIFENRLNKFVPFGSEYYTLKNPPPSNQIENEIQYALKASQKYISGDFSLYYMNLYDKKSYVSTDIISTFPVLVINSENKYSKVDIIGLGGNYVLNEFVIKFETSYISGLKYANALNNEEKKSLNLLLGFDYYGFKNSVLTIEVQNSHLYDFNDNLSQSPDFARQNFLETAISFQKNLLNDRLKLHFLTILLGKMGQGGSINRLTAEYELSSSLFLNFGLVTYGKGDYKYFGEWNENDRLFSGIIYKF